MKITIEVTQEELDEMGLETHEIAEYVVESIDSGGPQGNLELSGFNVYVKVVDDKVI